MEEIVALGLTIAIEVPVALIILRTPWTKVAIVAACASMVTHPLAWAIYNRGTSLLTVEIGVVTLEAVIFALLFPAHRTKAITAAVTMNVISALVGIIFF